MIAPFHSIVKAHGNGNERHLFTNLGSPRTSDAPHIKNLRVSVAPRTPMNPSEQADLLGQLASAHSSSSSSEELGNDDRRRSIPVKLQETDQAGQYLLTAEDAQLLHEVLQHNLHLEKSGVPASRRFRFRDLEFTRQLSTFDRQNPTFHASQFHGFFTLFWLGVALLILKVAANNWRVYGTIWGKNEIVRLMLRKDVLVLGLSDFAVCWSTLVCLGLQRLILRGYLRWSGLGWVLQNVGDIIVLARYTVAKYRGWQIWQTTYLGVSLWWTYHRDWPWTHTVFMVLHCLTMLMKQHSYAFYNGYRR